MGSPLSAEFSPLPIVSAGTTANTVLPEPGAQVTSPVNGTIVSWRLVKASGGPFSLRVLRPAGFGAYTGVGTSTPQVPVGPGVQVFATSLQIRAGDLIGFDDSPDADEVGIASVPGASSVSWFPVLADRSTRGPDSESPDYEWGFNADVQPANAFTFGKVRLNRSNGTAKLSVTVPNPGVLTLFGKGVNGVTRTSSAAQELTLQVRSKGKTKRKLNQTGKQKIRVTLQFVPTDGAPASQTKKLNLRKRRR